MLMCEHKSSRKGSIREEVVGARRPLRLIQRADISTGRRCWRESSVALFEAPAIKRSDSVL